MFNWIKDYQAKRTYKKRMGSYNDGFLWAMDSYFLNNMSIDTITNYCDSSNDNSAFDTGALEAVYHLKIYRRGEELFKQERFEHKMLSRAVEQYRKIIDEQINTAKQKSIDSMIKNKDLNK